ncbi:PhzF family phenazine biosynthesis protein [Roseomonas sp. E05]|uniref:PhzF family phenazine biosynthesis protein n=1 Tax=Roseomonas sp. E05 TaxID=3046310 RepID=UPI0024BBBBAC|nr:PhzF family phenazine biosynthesis protein [Roseomonas sp. E05]MDJ0389883.1 PhzF family phenazine biosynthesis protein [Roseomonas sp. E05]
MDTPPASHPARVPFYQVDAFAEHPFTGNPAAVVPLRAWLPDALMQRMAFEHNLSETAFFVPDGPGQWHLRWFTPTAEVPLCGHATLATAFVLASELGEPGELCFRTASGLLRVVREGKRLVLDFPANPPRRSHAPPPGLAAALGAVPREVWKGRDWICLFDRADTVRALSPDHGRIAGLREAGVAPGAAPRVIVTAPGDDGVHDVVSRYFAAAVGIPEDPVTGAAHVQLVPFWAGRLGQERLVCRQASARGGTLWCELRGDRVRMGGHAVLYAQGEVLLPAA